MAGLASLYANQLRLELAARNRLYAQAHAHVESYGNPPVIVYEPECGCHGNFFTAAYNAILSNPEWARRFDKIHTSAARSLPKAALDHTRRWRELDSCMSSDALLMNIFCAPGVANSKPVTDALGVDSPVPPQFGWKARVPLVTGRFDRTEVDMRCGSLLVEAKLTESDFQIREARIIESYRDFKAVFDPDMLSRVELTEVRRKDPAEFPEAYSQELESVIDATMSLETAAEIRENSPSVFAAEEFNASRPSECGYRGYQLIRNVLAAYATSCNFCVFLDERRPDLREDWFRIMAAVRSAELRVRLKVLTWQELAALLPEDLQDFLDLKYGIVAPGRTATLITDALHG